MATRYGAKYGVITRRASSSSMVLPVPENTAPLQHHPMRCHVGCSRTWATGMAFHAPTLRFLERYLQKVDHASADNNPRDAPTGTEWRAAEVCFRRSAAVGLHCGVWAKMPLSRPREPRPIALRRT